MQTETTSNKEKLQAPAETPSQGQLPEQFFNETLFQLMGSL